MKKSTFIVLLALSLAALHACRKPETGKQETIAAPPGQSDYFKHRVDTVMLRSLAGDLQFSGEITYDQNKVTHVFPMVSGTVLEIKAELGDYVRSGQTLATIRSGDLAVYSGDYQTARINYDAAKRNVQNTEAQLQLKLASELDLTRARADLARAESDLKKAESVFQLYGGNENGQPLYTVKAPQSGYIVEKNLTPGTQIRSDNAAPLFTISGLEKVWVMANVYESDIPNVKPGLSVQVNTLSFPDKNFPGKITNLSNALDPSARVLKARIEVDNRSGLLRPAMFANIRVSKPDDHNLPAINPRALVFDADKYFLVVETAPQKFEVRPVTVFKKTSQYAYIRSGVQPGEKVVTEGSLLIYNELTN